MDETTITNFLALLAAIVNDDAPWKEKAAAVRATMDDEDQGNLNEFVSWFGFEPAEPSEGEAEGTAA